MRAAIYTALLLIVGITPGRAVAQQLAVGDSISVRPTRSATPEHRWGVDPTRRPWTEASIVRVTEDTLWYRAGGEVAQLALEDAEVRRPTGRDRRMQGMLLGGLSGAVLGAFIGYHSYESEYGYDSIGTTLVCALNDCAPPPQTNSRAGEAAFAAFAGASVGGLLGYVMGRSSGRWESVRLTPAVSPTGTVSMHLRVGT